MSAVLLGLPTVHSYHLDRVGRQCRRRQVKPQLPLHPVSNPAHILTPSRRLRRHPSPEPLGTPIHRPSVAPSTRFRTLWQRTTPNRRPLKHNRNGSSSPPRRTEPPLQPPTSLQGVARKITQRSKRPPLLLAPSSHTRHLSTLLCKCNTSSMRHLQLNNNTKAFARTTLLPPLPNHKFLTPTPTPTRILKARTLQHPLSYSNPVGGLYIHPSAQQEFTTSSRIKAIGTNRTSFPLGLYGRYEICHTLITYATGRLTVSTYQMIFTCTVAVVTILECVLGNGCLNC